jgi:hypothetical protein
VASRIQFNRFDGDKLPAGAKLVTRPSRWGNPYAVGRSLQGYRAAVDADDAVEMFRKLIAASPAFQQLVRDELGGKDLACACRLDQVCHADILLRVAAGGEP